MTRRPRVAGAGEASRDPTALAMSVAEENLETTMALQPLEMRLIVRGKTEDVAEAEVASEDAEGSEAEVALEAVAVDSAEALEAASEDEEAVIEAATEGCHSEAAEAEVVAHHFVEVEVEEKAARSN